MGKVIGDLCEFCIPCDIMMHFLPPSAVEFMRENDILIENPDFEGDGDYEVINLSDYPYVSMSKEIVVDYLIEYNRISDESELEYFLESEYVDTDFDHLAEFVADNYPKVNFADCITNKDELLKEVRTSLKNDYNFQE